MRAPVSAPPRAGRSGQAAKAAGATGLKGVEKAAVLLLSLGEERAGEVVKHLGED